LAIICFLFVWEWAASYTIRRLCNPDV
jgi:hypothetical protein